MIIHVFVQLDLQQSCQSYVNQNSLSGVTSESNFR
jgi:hypothetical protein